jgi:hypothetical protein
VLGRKGKKVSLFEERRMGEVWWKEGISGIKESCNNRKE